MKNYREIPGWFRHEELFRDIISRMALFGPLQVAEVGCWKGRSSAYLSDLLYRAGGHLTTIDTFKGSGEPAHQQDTDLQAGRLEEVARQNLEGRSNVKIVRGRSTEVLATFPDASLDLIYIDGDHTQAGVEADIEWALKKLKPNGVLVGDDIDWPGVAAAVQSSFAGCPENIGIRGRAWVYSNNPDALAYSRAFTELFCATPCYGGQCYAAFTQSLLRTVAFFQESGLRLRVAVEPGDSLVQRSRNTMADAFLESPASHLLFIDSDIEFDPKDILQMIRADKDVICGIYPKKSIERPGWPVNYLAGSNQNIPTDPMGNVEIAEGPTGFMLIRRVVLLEMLTRLDIGYQQTLDSGETRGRHAFFDCAIVDGRYLSEDFLFCRRWRDLGGKVWAAPTVKLKHHGHHAFTGDYSVEFKQETSNAD